MSTNALEGLKLQRPDGTKIYVLKDMKANNQLVDKYGRIGAAS